MSAITDMVQVYHNNGDDDEHAVYNAANEIAESACETYDLDRTTAELTRLEQVLYEIIWHSVDWKQIADDDENAREWDEARRDALGK